MTSLGTSAQPEIDALVAALARALRARHWRIATAESCTGGLIATACTELAGASDWFERGFVAYSNAAKTESIGVAPTLIEIHGAVSEPVARAMAVGALSNSHAQLAVAVTGIAGPDGGSIDKPVGTVWIAWAQRAAGDTISVDAKAHRFPGDRAAVRCASVRVALQGLVERARSP